MNRDQRAELIRAMRVEQKGLRSMARGVARGALQMRADHLAKVNWRAQVQERALNGAYANLNRKLRTGSKLQKIGAAYVRDKVGSKLRRVSKQEASSWDHLARTQRRIRQLGG